MRSDAILMRLLELHPKIIDLSLTRMRRLLEKLGHPERKLPPVIHIAGTKGKGSTLAFSKAILEGAGLKVHAYTSPHLVRFHERITLAGKVISEAMLSSLLKECEKANAGEPMTFFEITTAAAFLAFNRVPADYLLLEVGLGGNFDATNVIAKPAVSVITSLGLDHQQYLGETIQEIAFAKAGILKPGVPGIIGPQEPAALEKVEEIAAKVGAPLKIANQDWQVYPQHGRFVFQDEDGLLDLPLPALPGAHQFDNAGNAIAAVRALEDSRITEEHFAKGMTSVAWPARMQKLGPGALRDLVPADTEVWLDGAHNALASSVIAQTLREMNATAPRPTVIIWGLLNTKKPGDFIANFKGLADQVIAITIPDELNAIPAEELVQVARSEGFKAEVATSIAEAVKQACSSQPASRILITGSLYLAGHVLALHSGEEASAVSGAAKR